VGVEVAVRPLLPRGVLVDVVVAPPPLQQQAHGEHQDDDPYRHLGGLLERLGEVASQQHEGEPDYDERRAVAEAPAEAHEGRFPDALSLLGGNERCDGG